MNKALLVILIVVTGWIAITVQSNQSQLSHLTRRLNTIENETESLKYNIESSFTDQTNEHNSSANEVVALLSSNSEIKEIPNVKDNSTTKNDISYNQTEDLDATKKLLNEVQMTGYINDEIWSNIDHQIKNMDSEQNKIFWQNMFSMIEDNKLDIYMGQN